MITLEPILTGLRGTQVTGSIIYTLVSKDRREGIVRAAPGCPFISIDIILFIIVMKRD
jgi:hypothetical protein